ncbi:hypothetical protein GW17_00023122 [Ensete ventricosum]|nr:hypothetical protein GW17_00023122 [Ensete ventricosum]
MMVKLSKAEKKVVYDKKLYALLDEYSKVLVAAADNVGSNQLRNIRKGLRGDSIVLMGKNTLIHRCIKIHSEKTGNKNYLNLLVVRFPLLLPEKLWLFAIATEYTFPQAEKVKEYLKVGRILDLCCCRSRAAAVPAEEKKEEPTEESDDDMGFWLVRLGCSSSMEKECFKASQVSCRSRLMILLSTVFKSTNGSCIPLFYHRHAIEKEGEAKRHI